MKTRILSILEHFQKYCSHSVGGKGQRFFWVLASFSLSHRPLWACSFAQASPKRQNSSLPNGYSISSNALATVISFMLLAASASAQSYSINWYKVAGGGGTSTGAQYTVTGTIGQPDASGTLSGGNYSLTGGFWAIISVVQTSGAPTLHISASPTSITVYWQNVSGWTLHQSSSLSPTAPWTLNSSWTTTNGTNYLHLSSPAGNQFFRLSNP